ncbi:MAG TPA: ice-binding family protein [Chloroflexota bacterium]|nr:ice-binding family protein [Chloroflexota bacterium]
MRPLRLLLAPVLACLLLGPILTPALVTAASLPIQTAPSLGTASTFVVLGGSTVTNTGSTVINANLGVSPGTAVTGFSPGVVSGGTIHSADLLAGLAQADITAAYTSLVGQTCPGGNDLSGQNLGGKTLPAGVYCFSSSAQLTGALTLDAQGNANAVFIFKIGSTLTTATNASVVPINGASPSNVFWQVGSSATLGTSTAFVGNILALTSITLNTGTVLSGRALARNGAVTLDTNTVGLVSLPAAPSSASAAPSLGSASGFLVLASTTVTNTGATTVNANLGVSPGTAVTGFPPGLVVGGTIHSADTLAGQAQTDTTAAYTSLVGRTCPGGNDLTGQNLGGKTLTAGVYCFSSSAQLTGVLTLDAQGNADAVFIFKIGSTLTTATNASVVTINGASPCNVFWQVGSSATLGTTTAFAGNIIALTSITLTTGTVVAGRALARNGAVTMDSNTISLVGCGAASVPAAQIALNSSLKIHPLLQYGAQNNPTGVVRVIVQQNGLLSGGATERFTVIPALVTSVQLGSIAALALDPNVRYISPDGPVQIIPSLQPIVGAVSGEPAVIGSFSGSTSRANPDSTHLSTTYPFDTGATSAWAGMAGPADSGAGVTVAILDSGVDFSHADLSGHVMAVNVNLVANGPTDGFGHGTHVAGVIAGQDTAGQYIGVAPGADVVSVKVSDDAGVTYESDVLRGLQWVSLHQTNYNIRVINLSLSASVPASYATSPIDAAVEHLWHQGVTVVASAGNLGGADDAAWYAPGNDPLVITVGCLDDNQTAGSGDDSLCVISSHGATEDGFSKPELVAPGRKIVSTLATGINGQPVALAKAFPERITADGKHIRLSGTSMSAPMVTGAVALLLARRAGLTPDQVKQLLVGTATAYPGQADRAGELNIVSLLQANVPPGVVQTPTPISGSVAPAGRVTLLWDGTRWADTYWSSAHWDTAHWDTAHWDSTYWDTAHWDTAHWDSAHWDSAHWDSAHWDSSAFD